MRNSLVAPVGVGLSLLFLLLTGAASVRAQVGPHIGSVFPGGASAGTSVDIQINGGNLVGVHSVLVSGGPGVSAQIIGGANAVDESARPLFTNKCTTCHEARSPENRGMSPDQWAQTVNRMITQHGAQIQTPDRDRIIAYLQGLARAGQIAAHVTVAPGTPPGLREMRLLTDHGISTATSFEVGRVPEMNAPKFATGKPEEAPTVTLPIAVNGILSQAGERHWYRFAAKKGQRLTFNLKAERLNGEASNFFFPTLYLYDADGHELAKNLGKYGIDPFLDYLIPADGQFLILVHDLLWHGTPGSVYRLTMGEIPADGILSPGWARPGTSISARLVPADGDAPAPALASAAFSVQVPMGADGMTNVATPVGEAPLLVRDLPDGGGPQSATPVALPALFRGGVGQPGQKNSFLVRATRGGTGLDVYAQRLGSPLRAEVTVKNQAGDIIATRTADPDVDVRLPNAFPRPGDYTVEITDADGHGGPGYLYCWETTDRGPDLRLSVTPDVANLAPGTNMTLLVKAPRRQNINGPVLLTVRGLPAGVTTTGDTVLLPDMNEAAIVLTASPGAVGGTGGLITLEGRTLPGTDGTPAVMRRVDPIELYVINNNQMTIPRTTVAAAVITTPPVFSLTALNGQTSLTISGKEDIRIPVSIHRQDGYKGSLFVTVQGLPGGLSATQNTYNIPPNETATTVVLRVNRDARFFKDKPVPGEPPVHIVIAGFQGNNGNDFVPTVTSPPITLLPQ